MSIPSSRAIRCAVPALSPVSMASCTPRSRNLTMVAAAVGRGASAMAMRPISLLARATCTKVELLGVHQPSISQEDSLPIDLGPYAHALDVFESLRRRNGEALSMPQD